MFSEGFRQVPRKLIRLIKENPNAVLMYCYLVDHMDDRAEMTYKMCVAKECDGMGMTRKMARDALSDLVALGGITASRSGNGVLVSVVNYCNCSGPREGHVRATKRATSRATLNKADIVDIFGNIEDDIISEGHVEGHVEGQHFEQSRATLGGVLYRGDKREKIKKNTSSSTASIDAADSQEDANPPWLTLVNHWNEQLPTYRKVLVEFLRKNEKRKKSINAIIKTVGMETLFEVIKIIPTSKFLSGESECDFKAYFDWIIKIDNIQKILEGKFTDTKEAPKKIEFTTFIKDFKPCVDAGTKLREKLNNEKG